MNAVSHDRSPVWISMVDMALAVLAVALIAVNPPLKASGVPEKAEYLVTIDWPVTIDADVDDWLVMPGGKPVFYGARDVGCARLDTDSRGFLDGQITLADGAKISVDSYKETIQLRCIQSGHYEFGANLYAFHKDNVLQTDAKNLGVKVHAEIVALNPTYKVVFSKDVVLDDVGQTINLTGFDLARDGSIKLTSPPLESITATYQRRPTP